MIPPQRTFGGQSYKLFDDYNDFHLYVEDNGFENLYFELFSKTNKIKKVFSLNGKFSVLRKASVCTDRKCIYLVDLDWDDLLGVNYDSSNVVVLDKNSIESYLIDYPAFSKIILGDRPKDSLNDILNESQFENIICDISNKLRQLFECFASLQISDEAERGCSYPPGNFQQNNATCSPDTAKIEAFILEKQVSIPSYVSEYFSERNLLTRGHGKYMLHFMWNELRRTLSLNKLSIDRLMYRLATYLDSDDINALVEKVITRVTTNIGTELEINN